MVLIFGYPKRRLDEILLNLKYGKVSEHSLFTF